MALMNVLAHTPIPRRKRRGINPEVIQGPDAQVIGEAVSTDFPDVLVGLDKYIQKKGDC